MLKPLSIAAALAVAAVSFQSSPSKTPLQAMIDQERAFAKLAVEKGTRDAFLEYLADESLLFTPGPTPGKLYYKNRPALPMKLRWVPEFADVIPPPAPPPAGPVENMLELNAVTLVWTSSDEVGDKVA